MKRKTPKGPGRAKVVFLFDVDNTLLDNDRVIADLRQHLKREVGPKDARHYWDIFERLRTKLGYADYLGAVQRYRSGHPHDLRLLTVSRFLINYPFANRLLPNSLDVIERVKRWGTAVLLTDGDVVFQPRKVDCSGLYEAVGGHALIYVHKEHELADVEARYPSDHYVLVDDKRAAIRHVDVAPVADGPLALGRERKNPGEELLAIGCALERHAEFPRVGGQLGQRQGVEFVEVNRVALAG